MRTPPAAANKALPKTLGHSEKRSSLKMKRDQAAYMSELELTIGTALESPNSRIAIKNPLIPKTHNPAEAAPRARFRRTTSFRRWKTLMERAGKAPPKIKTLNTSNGVNKGWGSQCWTAVTGKK